MLLQNNSFCQAHGVKYPYVSGSMYHGISSVPLVVAMAKENLLSFFGTGGLSLEIIEQAIIAIKSQLSSQPLFGMNLLCDLEEPQREMRLVECYLQHDIRIIEASAYLKITPALVWYRLTGLTKNPDGKISANHKIMAKISRVEIAKLFSQPAPRNVVAKLLADGKITAQQAELSAFIPMADDITVEADSAGHTDQRVLTVIFPAIKSLIESSPYAIRVGAAGGLGTPPALAAAFIMGADYVVTGSINQCTVESGASDTVKTMLQSATINDMTYAPAGDMFELGAKVQVFKRGLLFPVRANKLYELYKQYDSIESMDPELQETIASYFKRSFIEVWDEVFAYYSVHCPEKLARAVQHQKQKMALLFRWYFGYTNQLAFAGNSELKTDFQIHCGPALGAFNAWVADSWLEPWQNRFVAEIAIKLMDATALLLSAALSHTITTAK